MKVTPKIIRLVRKIKEDYPDTPHWRIAKCTGVSASTVSRILRDEYLIIKGKVVRIKAPSPGQMAMLKQFQKVIKAVAHQTAEMSRENKRRNSLKEENMEKCQEAEGMIGCVSCPYGPGNFEEYAIAQKDPTKYCPDAYSDRAQHCGMYNKN